MRARLIIAAQTGALIGLGVLAVFQARQLRQSRLDLESAIAPAPEIPPSTNQRPLRLRLQALPPINVRTEVYTLDWRHLESEDYATYVANLRKIGCPEDTIRDIIVADVNKLYAARRRALPPPKRDVPFWRHPDEFVQDPHSAEAERAHHTQLASLERERRALLHKLLGDSAVHADLAEYAAQAGEDLNLQFLSPEKRQAIAEATANQMLALDEAAGAATEEERTRLITEANRTLDEAIAKSLTPEERAEYEMRTDPLADSLRDRLRGFGASREEFEQLFKLERQFESERTSLREAAAAGNEPQAAEKAEATILEQESKVRELLGPARFAEFQRSNDPDYQTLFSLAHDHALSSEIANEVWNMRSEVESQTDRIRQNPFLTAEQKTRALQAIRNETQAAIVGVLGEPLLKDYQRQGGGWLIDLTEPQNLGVTGLQLTPPPLPGIPQTDGSGPLIFPVP